MDTKANYAEVNKRIVAYVVDQITFFLVFALFFDIIFPGIALVQDQALVDLIYLILGELIYVILEVLMITKLGWTPGKLLCGIHIKSAKTLKNIPLAQAVIRSTLKTLLFVPFLISEWFLILPILALTPAIFDQRKQTFYDKTAKTVVMDYKPEESHLNVNYVGIIRRATAHVIDCCTIMGIISFCLIFIKIIFHPDKLTRLIVQISLFFLLSIIFGVFVIKRLGSTPGQWLCRICIKNANTLENITLMQAIMRCVLFEVINFISIFIFIMNVFLLDQLISKWWFEPLSDLAFVAIILIFVSAIFDQRKQFFHDKIARVVAINYKSSS